VFIVQDVFKAADVPIQFEEFWISEVQDRCTEENIQEAIDSVTRNKVAIKGVCETFFIGTAVCFVAPSIITAYFSASNVATASVRTACQTVKCAATKLQSFSRMGKSVSIPDFYPVFRKSVSILSSL